MHSQNNQTESELGLADEWPESTERFIQWRISEIIQGNRKIKSFLSYREALLSLGIEAFTIFSTLAKQEPDLTGLLPDSTAHTLLQGEFGDLSAREIYALIVIKNDSCPVIPTGPSHNHNYILRQFVDLGCLLAEGANETK